MVSTGILKVGIAIRSGYCVKKANPKKETTIDN